MADPDIPGWMSHFELQGIANRVAGFQDVLEIGTYCGRTTRTLLQHTEGLVFSVDPVEREKPHHPDARKHIRGLAEEYPSRLVFIPALSCELIWARPIDVLFIDGSHQYERVLSDLLTFTPFLTPNGRLICDDWRYPDVERAITELRFPQPPDTFGKLASWQTDQISSKIPSS